MRKLIATMIAVAALSITFVAEANVNGTYKLDVRPLIAQVQARIAKLPPRRRMYAGMAIKMIRGMQMYIFVAADGKAGMKMQMSFFGRTRKRMGVGSWSQQGNTLIVKTTSKSRRRTRKETIKCTITKGGKRLACLNQNQRSKQILYFDKISDKTTGFKPAAPTSAPTSRPASRVPTKTAKKVVKRTPASRPAVRKAPASRPAARK